MMRMPMQKFYLMNGYAFFISLPDELRDGLDYQKDFKIQKAGEPI